MGRRSRRRSGEAGVPQGLDDAVIELPGGDTISLRCSLTPKTRQQYAGLLSGEDLAAAATREDAWQRAAEFLFERLVSSWSVADVLYSGQKQLLQRWRVASAGERQAVRDALRQHLAEWFPDMTAP